MLNILEQLGNLFSPKAQILWRLRFAAWKFRGTGYKGKVLLALNSNASRSKSEKMPKNSHEKS